MTERIKILIVEDDLLIAEELAETINILGFHALKIADSGEKALELIKTLSPELVLMDIGLPGKLDGIATAQEIRERFKLPVIFLTSHSDPETLRRAKIVKPYGYIVKPYQETELRIAIELALYNHYPKQINLANREVKSNPRTIECLSHIKLFQELSDVQLANFSKNITIKSLKASEHICHEDENFNEGVLVITGRIALVKLSANGRELITDLLHPGNIFGLTFALEDSRTTSSIRAQIISEVLLVPKATLSELFETYPQLYRPFISTISKRLKRSHALSRALAHDRIEVRVASSLLTLQADLRDSSLSKVNEVPITRQELASLTGTTVETAIRVTKALEREKILDLSKQGTIQLIATDQLKELAEL